MGRYSASLLVLAVLSLEASSFVFPQLASTASRVSRSRAPHSSRSSSIPHRTAAGCGVVLQSTTDETTETAEEVRLEDRDVPQAHRGLHDFLYSNEEDHGATASDGSVELFDGTQLYEVSKWLKDNAESKHAAVYAVVGKDETVNFVGVGRNVALSLAAHLAAEGESMVHLLKVRSFKFPKRDKMEALKAQWIEECGSTPVGNIEGSEWATGSKDAQGAMSPAQKEAYEENKLKMRKAIADPGLVDETEQMSSEDIERRKRLESAVEDDDWSSVIDGQTKLTEEPKAEVDAPTATIISPFSSDGMPVGVGPDGMAAPPLPPGIAAPAPEAPPAPPASECNDLEFTLENVDKVLDEVRPYLIADGGNVRVMGVDIDRRVVKLALQGACGSCPSSTTTMKMGIERVLNENFLDMGGVEQVDEASGNAMAEATTAVVEAILEPLRPAMVAMRAKVEVLSVLDGHVKLTYSGHRKVAYGIQMALMDNPLIQSIDFEYVD
ncbi:unnamed protein product [Ectocarpus fasciculatus]